MTARKGSVRIIGGQHRGRRLAFTDQNGDLRPTGDRLRETLFNWLQPHLPGARVLDLFAGSGALAAEALSRGAGYATVVEKKRERAADLSRQLKPIFAGSVFVQCADAMKWLERAGDDSRIAPFDLVFVDPPYDTALQGAACARLVSQGLLAPGALVYVESARHGLVPEVPAGWLLRKDKEGGDVRAQLYEVPA
ncbi:MAG: 16S rRNA (guanine(966)-N(2))-methyltransferase RsmD [Alcanivoracaceae bacterium]|jgi:16S rRNA (guanine966-N2)-methyltransferase|nr:16S rRNA (guanine(966)-N(2))-methyltransferase RsmD [Alcanivoracaceae bacterium]